MHYCFFIKINPPKKNKSNVKILEYNVFSSTLEKFWKLKLSKENKIKIKEQSFSGATVYVAIENKFVEVNYFKNDKDLYLKQLSETDSNQE